MGTPISDTAGTFPVDRLKSGFDDLLRSAPPKAETLVLTLPIPAVRPETIARSCPSDDTFLWYPPAGPVFAGSGEAVRIDVQGESRISSLHEKAGRLWKSLAHIAPDASEAPDPVLFGGLSFSEGACDEPPWLDFGDGSFIIPRWQYAQKGDRAWLSLALHGPDERDRYPLYAGDLDRLAEGIARGDTTVETPPAGGAQLVQMERDHWRHMIESIRQGIADERFAKVVAARRSIATLEEEVDPLVAYAHLGRSYGDCYRFLFQRGSVAFLGATPERLVRREGREIATEALAGSIDTAGTEEGQRRRTVQLLESQKDLGEHELVVDAIRRKLAPLCAELRVSARPQIRALRNVMHLRTPMTGILAHDHHILDLVAALHPTPSVGGAPTANAVGWIVTNEPDRRGWYAGPVGWFDADGDGDFAVALRSGVIQGTRAYLYVGAGIVHDSDPDKEYDETSTKQKPILRALGIKD